MVIVYIYCEMKKCGRQAIYIRKRTVTWMGLANDMSDVVPTKILQLQIKSEKGESDGRLRSGRRTNEAESRNGWRSEGQTDDIDQRVRDGREDRF